MALNTRVLFGVPQTEIATLLRHLLQGCERVHIVTGFATVAGIETMLPALEANPGKLELLLVGAGTYQAFDAMDRLTACGVSPSNLFIHLGHTKPKGRDQSKVWGYHPMMHSKIYLFGLPHNQAAAIIGSHNVTKFALQGMNSEASILLNGPADDPDMRELYRHVEQCRNESCLYDPSLKAGFAWWSSIYFDELRIESLNVARDVESHQTVVVLLAMPTEGIPKSGETIYFELPLALKQKIHSTNTEVHILFFRTAPSTAKTALADRQSRVTALKCKVYQIDDKHRTREVEADWMIQDRRAPIIASAPRPFRPESTSGMQQVSAEVEGPLDVEYEYLFESEKVAWKPMLDENSPVLDELTRNSRLSLQKHTETRMVPVLSSLNLVGDSSSIERYRERRTDRKGRQFSREDEPEWFLVRGLQRVEVDETESVALALKDASPESESFVLFSVRRRRLGKRTKGV